MDTRTKEAVRYLGYGNHAVDGQTLELIRDSFEELDRVADKRITYYKQKFIKESVWL